VIPSGAATGATYARCRTGSGPVTTSGALPGVPLGLQPLCSGWPQQTMGDYLAYRAFGVEPSSTYREACRRIAGAFIADGAYERPSKQVGQMRDSAHRGPFVVAGEDGVKRGRSVHEHWDKERHMEEAASVRPPTRAERSGYTCRADTVAAIRFCLDKGDGLPGWRRKQKFMLGEVRKMLEPENRVLRAAQPPPPNVRSIAGDVNIAMMCALVDSMAWPDVMLPYKFATGFESVGEIPDSGVYRRVESVLDDQAADELRKSVDATNEAWLGEVCGLLRRRAEKAGPEEAEAMRVLKAKSDAEAASGLCAKPITLNQLLRKYTRKGKLQARILPRFGVWQGRASARKVRAIDDGRMSRTNEITRTHETITTPSPEFPAHVVDELARACVERGIPIPDVELGLDDLFAAYRRIPTRHQEYMIAAVWDMETEQPIFYEVYGHCFGLVSSVLNFNRVPHLMCVAAALLFAAPVDHFFDDYLTMDLKVGRGSAQECLDALHNAVRLRLEPKKRKRSASVQEELGVECDLRKVATERVVLLAPTPARVADILADLQACQDAGEMSPATAERLFGRISFALTATIGAFGRAATQPLLQRAHEPHRRRAAPFTDAMRRMLEFFRAVLPSLPPLAVQCGPGHVSDMPPVIVYTDASYNERGWSGLGIVVIDGSDVWEAGCRVPEWLLQWLRPRGQQVNHLEEVAAVAARLTFPDVLHQRKVLHFIDNTVALSKAVHGYAKDPDMAAVVNSLHACDAALGIDAWFEWVPSHANVSDLPSRDPAAWDDEARVIMGRIRARMAARGISPRVLQLPTVAQLDDPLLMMEASRALAADAVADKQRALVLLQALIGGPP